MQRVEQIGSRLMSLCGCRDSLTTNRIVRVVGVNETHIVWCDGHTERCQRFTHTFLFLFGEGDVFVEFFEGLNTMSHLPFPVVPLFIGNIRKEFFSSVYLHNI